MALNPSNSEEMASIGYDNAVRIWDINTTTVTSIIEEKQSKGIERDG